MSNLEPRENTVLNVVKESGRAGVQIGALLPRLSNLSSDQIKRTLCKLIEKKLVEMRGARRRARYFASDQT